MQKEKKRLIELLKGKSTDTDADVEYVADFLLEKGILVAPMPMANWLREELTAHIEKRCFEEF